MKMRYRIALAAAGLAAMYIEGQVLGHESPGVGFALAISCVIAAVLL